MDTRHGQVPAGELAKMIGPIECKALGAGHSVSRVLGNLITSGVVDESSVEAAVDSLRLSFQQEMLEDLRARVRAFCGDQDMIINVDGPGEESFCMVYVSNNKKKASILEEAWDSVNEIYNANSNVIEMFPNKAAEDLEEAQDKIMDVVADSIMEPTVDMIPEHEDDPLQIS